MAVTKGSLEQDPVDSNSELEPTRGPGSYKKSWYRSVPFQIAVASGVSFTAPGMWDALGGLGAGGAAQPVSPSLQDYFLRN